MRYQAKPAVVLTDSCGKFFLAKADRTIEINECGALYWKELLNSADENDLLDAAGEYYEFENKETVIEEIRGFLKALLEAGLIGLADEPYE